MYVLLLFKKTFYRKVTVQDNTDLHNALSYRDLIMHL